MKRLVKINYINLLQINNIDKQIHINVPFIDNKNNY